jgi:VanZ family protein
MKSQRSEILGRMVRFLNLDPDGLRRIVLESIVEAREFTVASIHEIVSKRYNVSRKVVASMIGYICSRLGILHVNKKSYRAPRTYILRDEYADIARAVLATL